MEGECLVLEHQLLQAIASYSAALDADRAAPGMQEVSP